MNILILKSIKKVTSIMSFENKTFTLIKNNLRYSPIPNRWGVRFINFWKIFGKNGLFWANFWRKVALKLHFLSQMYIWFLDSLHYNGSFYTLFYSSLRVFQKLSWYPPPPSIWNSTVFKVSTFWWFSYLYITYISFSVVNLYILMRHETDYAKK